MKIIGAYAENAYAFPKLELSEDFFDFNGVTTILGYDTSTGRHNGVSKTKLISFLYYMFTGEEVKGGKVGDIKRFGADNGFYGEITFIDDRGRRVRIQRYIDYKPYEGGPVIMTGEGLPQSKRASGLDLEVEGAETCKSDRMGKDVIQPIIDGMIGMSAELFRIACITPQKENAASILLAPKGDAKKKELFDEMTGALWCRDANAFAKGEAKVKSTAITAIKAKQEGIYAVVNALSTEAESLKVQANIFDKRADQEAETISAKIATTEEKLKALESSRPQPVDTSALQLQRTEVSKKSQDLESAFKQKESELKKVLSDLATASERRRAAEASVAARNAELTKLVQANANKSESFRPSSQIHAELEVVTAKIVHPDAKVREARVSMDSALRTTRTDIDKMAALIEIQESDLANEKMDECPTCSRPFDDEGHKAAHAAKVATKRDLLTKKLEAKAQAASKLEELEKKSAAISKQADLIAQRDVLKAELANARNAEGMEAQIEEKKASVKLAQDELARVAVDSATEFKALEAEISASLKELSAQRAELVRMGAGLDAEFKGAVERNQLIASHDANVVAQKEALLSLNNQLAQIGTQSNPYFELIEQKNAEVALKKEQIEKYASEIKDLEAEIRVIEFAENGFGPNGIPSFLSDSIIDILNERVAEYMEDIFHGAVSVHWSPEKQGGKAGTVNNITCQIMTNSSVSNQSLWSGGEETATMIATNLGWSDITAMKSGRKAPLKVLDEPFEGLDTAGQMACLALLNKIAEKRQMPIFVISHNDEFMASSRRSIFILKEEGMARIVDREEYIRVTGIQK